MLTGAETGQLFGLHTWQQDTSKAERQTNGECLGREFTRPSINGHSDHLHESGTYLHFLYFLDFVAHHKVLIYPVAFLLLLKMWLHTAITSASLFPLPICLFPLLSVLLTPTLPFFIGVGSHEPLAPFPGGHPLPSPPSLLTVDSAAALQLSSLSPTPDPQRARHYGTCFSRRGRASGVSCP